VLAAFNRDLCILIDSQYGKYLGHISIALPHLKSLKVFREIEVGNSDESAACRSQTTLASVGRNLQGLKTKMRDLERFESSITSLPPLHNDRKLHEYSNRVRSYQHRFVAECGRDTTSPSEPTLYCCELTQAKAQVSEAIPGVLGRHWDAKLEEISTILATRRNLRTRLTPEI
jgi:hypothetical protein